MISVGVGQFAMDTVAWAQVLLRLKAAADGNVPVELTGEEARLIVKFSKLMAISITEESK